MVITVYIVVNLLIALCNLIALTTNDSQFIEETVKRTTLILMFNTLVLLIYIIFT